LRILMEVDYHEGDYSIEKVFEDFESSQDKREKRLPIHYSQETVLSDILVASIRKKLQQSKFEK
jgi:hypothetical protein